MSRSSMSGLAIWSLGEVWSGLVLDFVVYCSLTGLKIIVLFFFRNQVALHYVRGLCWVLRYYYQGCASWKWYFPYHYAPFASDFCNIAGLSTEFETGTEPVSPNCYRKKFYSLRFCL